MMRRGPRRRSSCTRAAGFTPLEDWSRDGRFLLYDALDWRTFRSDVWVRDLEAGTDRLVLSATFNEFGARLSPDGRWLAYGADESGRRSFRPELSGGGCSSAGFHGRRNPAALARRRSRALRTCRTIPARL